MYYTCSLLYNFHVKRCIDWLHNRHEDWLGIRHDWLGLCPTIPNLGYATATCMCNDAIVSVIILSLMAASSDAVVG